ncbi:16S rRNA (cytidine(1402)-2'-O)-methyltransferase [Legionella sp. CNM-4043-24]|uniref:16S rRNA (cytidine(1402)-2'-O)-methyltransferase n=1 Tax=Legionella sp. CNM-4043-24 TaxID=3421646 RepID=UPI00403AA4AA
MENSSSTFSGTLYVVATPIGNLDDITLRAVQTLKSVDSILAEDTRHSLQLLHALGIQKPLLALHDHNESSKSTDIISALKLGKNFALISDAGTPLISDPGFILVRLAQQEGIRVVPVPGACALITALCASGVPCDSFLFAGFLPARQQARLTRLEELSHSGHSTIFYESTHRIMACLDDVIQVYGCDYRFVLAKELTKTFEHIMHASGQEIIDWMRADTGRVKGEFVLILPARPARDTQVEDEKLLRTLLSELPLKQAVKLACQLSASPKNDLYKLALSLSDK